VHFGKKHDFRACPERSRRVPNRVPFVIWNTYGMILRKDEDGDWVARIEELHGCTAHGKTRGEALENLEEVQAAWLEDALEAGDEIPEPQHNELLPSGKWLQRVPKSLHKKLAELAKQEGVSLNQMATSILAEAVGKRLLPVRALVRSHESQEAIWSYYALQGPTQIEWRIDSPKLKAGVKILDALSGTVATLPNEIVLHTDEMGIRVERKKNLRPTKRDTKDYTEFLRDIQLIALGLASCSAKLDRDLYFDVVSQKSNTRTISSSYELKDVQKEFFDVAARFSLQVQDKMKTSTPLLVECAFMAHFHCKAREVPRDFAARFSQSELRIVLWPYFREFVSDVTSKMAIPPLLIPLSAAQ